MGWAYIGSHPALVLFTEALAAGAPLRFMPGMRLLEIGCAERDWLSLASDAWPGVDVVGIDWNVPTNVRPGMLRRTANAMDASLYEADTFDGIVALSAIEHMGLGHYGDPPDPVCPDGDSTVVANAARWLKPGGWFYYDVPYSPQPYQVIGTSHRVYSNRDIFLRLRTPSDRWWSPGGWKGYADRHGHLCDEPVVPSTSANGFDHYRAMLWRKR